MECIAFWFSSLRKKLQACIPLCVCIHCTCVFVCALMCVCAGQRLISGVFLSHSLSCFLKEGFSVNLHFDDLARLLMSQPAGSSHLCLLSAGLETAICHWAWLLHECWASKFRCHACAANTLSSQLRSIPDPFCQTLAFPFLFVMVTVVSKLQG